MHPEREPYLRISAEWPRGEVEDEGEEDAPFVVGISSMRREAGGHELAPWIVDVAHGLLDAGLARAWADGYRLHFRIGCARVAEDADTLEDAARILRVLARTAAEVRYPLTFWLCPRGATGAAWAVAESNGEPEDPELFREALRAGAVWLSFCDVFIDVISDGAVADVVMRWLREAVSASAAPVRWSLPGPD